MNYKTKDKISSNQKQIIVILAYISLFFLSAVFSTVTNKERVRIINVMFIVDIIWIYHTICYILFYNKYNAKDIIKKGYLIIKNNIEIAMVLIISALMRIGMLDNMQKWDAGEYYYRLGTACQNFDFTFKGFMGFVLCGHPTLGFATLMAIGEFQNPRGIVGVMIVNLIITLMAIFCIYKMLTEYWSEMSKKMSALCSFICSVLPLFLGTFSYFNPDYVLAIFAIFLMYSEYKKQYIMFAFWACMLCMTKETGLIILVGYVGFRAIIYFFKYRGKLWYKIERSFEDKINLATLVPMIMYFIYSIIRGGMFTWSQNAEAEESNFRWSNTDINCIGFQPSYILTKWKQFFVMNFAWLIYLVIVIAVIGIIYKLIKKKKLKIKIEAFYGFAGIMIAYFLFSCIYVTSALYRYNVIWILFSGILCCVLLVEVSNGMNKLVPIVVLCVLGVCTTLQSFLCVDPVSMEVIQTIYTGTNKMLFSSNIDYYGDTMVYNYQYLWIDKTYEQMLRNVEYNEKMDIIVSGREWLGSQINGNPNCYKMYWDKDKKIRTMLKTENTINLKVRSAQSFIPERDFPMKSGMCESDIEELSSELTLCFLPYFGEDEEHAISILDNYYDVGERQTDSQFYGEINYYKLIKKNDLENISTISEKIASLDNIPADNSSEVELPENAVVLLQQLNLDIMDEELAVAIYNYGEKEVLDEVNDGRTRVQIGDIVEINCKVYRNGQFWKKQVFQVRVGTNEMIPELSEALIGKQVGEAVDTTCQMPVEYWNNIELSNATIKFEMSIQSIKGKLSTDISNKYVKKISDYKNVEDFKTQLIKEIQEEKIKQFLERTLHSIMNESKFIQYNEIERQAFENEYYNYYVVYAKENGLTLEEYVQEYLHTSMVDFEKKANKYAAYMWKKSMVMKALAEKYEVTNDDTPEDVRLVKFIEDMGYTEYSEQAVMKIIVQKCE